MIDPEELERCKDPRYFYNNYWRIDGRPVEPVSEQEWNDTMKHYPITLKKRNRLFNQNQASAEQVARIISDGKTSVLLIAKEFIDHPMILILKWKIGEENLIIDPQYGDDSQFIGYRIELKTKKIK